jgi:hypothetical protein
MFDCFEGFPEVCEMLVGHARGDDVPDGHW